MKICSTWKSYASSIYCLTETRFQGQANPHISLYARKIKYSTTNQYMIMKATKKD